MECEIRSYLVIDTGVRGKYLAGGVYIEYVKVIDMLCLSYPIHDQYRVSIVTIYFLNRKTSKERESSLVFYQEVVIPFIYLG